MKTIYFLTMMQLKDKLDMSEKTKKSFMFDIVFALLKFGLITAVIFLALYLLGRFNWVSLDGQIPVEVMVVLFSIMLTLSIITCTIKIMDSLYFGKDNMFLLTLPATKSQLFISKIFLFFIYELKKNIYYLLPVFIAYGMVNGYPAGYYFWLIPCFVIFTTLVVAIGGLLSIPAMLISMLLKRYAFLKTIMASLLIAVFVAFIVMLINQLPDSFDLVATWGTTYWKIQDFLTAYSQKMAIFTIFSKFIVGIKIGKVITLFTAETFTYFLEIIALIAIIFTASVLIARPLFFKMASAPFEFKKEEGKKKENVSLSPFMSFVKKEVLLILRTPAKLNSLIIMSVGTPLVVFLMNKIYSAMETSDTGKFMILGFNMLMITLMVTSTSVALAKCLSEEGNAHNFTKLNPNKYSEAVLAKLIFNVFVMTVSIIVCVIVFSSQFAVICKGSPITFNVFHSIMMFFVIEGIYLAHALWSVQIDIMNPHYEQYARVGEMINDPNEVKSNIISFTLSLLTGLFTYVNCIENAQNMNKVWIKLFIGVIIFLVFKVYMYIQHIELYYKEK